MPTRKMPIVSPAMALAAFTSSVRITASSAGVNGISGKAWSSGLSCVMILLVLAKGRIRPAERWYIDSSEQCNHWHSLVGSFRRHRCGRGKRLLFNVHVEPLSGLSKSTIKASLGPVLIGNGSVEIGESLSQALYGANHLCRTDNQDVSLADSSCLLHALQALVERFSRVPQALGSFGQSGRCGSSLRLGLHHLGSDPVLGAEQFENCLLIFGLACADRCAIANEQILKLPQELDVGTVSHAEVAKVPINAAPERAR